MSNTDSQPPLPSEPGYYLWYIYDLHYMNVGLVQVSADYKEHIRYCEDHPGPLHHIYELEVNHTLYKDLELPKPKRVMHHQAHDHLPPTDGNGRPQVDGWIPFDFRWVDHYRKFDPIKLAPKRLPRRQ